MKKTTLTRKVMYDKCKKRLRTDLGLYAGGAVLCLCLALVFLRLLREIPLLYLILFGAALLFIALSAFALCKLFSVRLGRCALETGTVAEKKPLGMCDTRSYTLTFTYGDPVKTVRFAELSLQEYAAAEEGSRYCLLVMDILFPQVLAIFPAEEYELPGK